MLIRIVFLLIILLLLAVSDAIAQTRVHFIDVGYGDAILLESSNEFAMIDVGGEATADDVVEYLHSRNVNHLQFIIITHDHENHFGALPLLQKHFSIDQILRGALAGKNITLGSINMSLLHPVELTGGPNEDSIVTFLKANSKSMLLTGDIRPNEQDMLLQNFPQIKQSSYVQVSHHGDRMSDSFSQAFADVTWLVSTGFNEYGLPDEEHLAQLDGQVKRTDKDGTFVITLDEK